MTALGHYSALLCAFEFSYIERQPIVYHGYKVYIESFDETCDR